MGREGKADNKRAVLGGTVLTLNDQWSLFGQYVHRIEVIYLDETDNTRLSYDFSRVDAGYRWKNKWIDLPLGYPFD